MAASQMRAIGSISRSLRVSHRAFSMSARRFESSVSTSKAETSLAEAERELPQSPNRVGVWSRSQKPRVSAMTGPRFEQTDFDLQPQPLSAMEMVHQQPVIWTHSSMAVCEGTGEGKGHPKIYINTDKPEIAVCGYCGQPYANEHNRKHLESLPETSYPLS